MAEPAATPRPVWDHQMPGACWQLLWWLIARMDERGEIHEGWRVQAAKQMKRDRSWITKSASTLESHGFLETAPRKRYARVIVRNLVG